MIFVINLIDKYLVNEFEQDFITYPEQTKNVKTPDRN